MKPGISRRTLVKWLMGGGVLSMLAAMASGINSLKPLTKMREKPRPAAGDRLVFASGPDQGRAITKADLPLGKATLAFPEGKEANEENLIILAHLEELQPPTRLEWTAQGFVAYSAICTHLCCDVLGGLKNGFIDCPCHGGIFDARRGATVVAGPPPRPLPQLPIKMGDGDKLVVAGEFGRPVGCS
ncbi:MAG: ubiquinol-cytochrome c reductase iron-sulfur subunit [Candidatus Bipolaricaulia bacterium]